MRSRKTQTPTPPAGRSTVNRFRRTEAARLIRSVTDAGLSVARVEVDAASGKISVVPGNPEASHRGNPWDEVLKNADTKRPA